MSDKKKRGAPQAPQHVPSSFHAETVLSGWAGLLERYLARPLIDVLFTKPVPPVVSVITIALAIVMSVLPIWQPQIYYGVLARVYPDAIDGVRKVVVKDSAERLVEKSKGPLKVAALFQTKIAEPWDGAIHAALERAQKDGLITYEHQDAVPAGQMAYYLQKYAEAHYDIVMGDAFGAEPEARRVADKYHNTAFIFGSAQGPTPPNFSVFDNWIHEPAYVAGMIAARLSKNKKVGIVAGKSVPEVNRLVNAFVYGVKDEDPHVAVTLEFIGSWYDPAKAAAKTQELIDRGADVFYAERDGVITECEKHGIPVIGNIIDQTQQSDDVVTSVYWDMYPTVKRVVEQVQNHLYTGEDYGSWSRMYKEGSALRTFPLNPPWSTRLGPDFSNEIQGKYDEIVTGRYRVPVIESPPVINEDTREVEYVPTAPPTQDVAALDRELVDR